jgi:hypothetical protein
MAEININGGDENINGGESESAKMAVAGGEIWRRRRLANRRLSAEMANGAKPRRINEAASCGYP